MMHGPINIRLRSNFQFSKRTEVRQDKKERVRWHNKDKEEQKVRREKQFLELRLYIKIALYSRTHSKERVYVKKGQNNERRHSTLPKQMLRTRAKNTIEISTGENLFL